MGNVHSKRIRAAARVWHICLGGILLAPALAVMMFAIPSATAAFKYLKTGSEVPDFTVKAVDGQDIAIADYKGAPASLVVFWATWSPRSRPALEDAQKLFAEYGDKGFKVLAINVNGLDIGHEDRRDIKAMKEELSLTLPVAVDEGLATYNAFGVVATPSMAVLDPDGRIIFEAASYLKMTGENIREQVEVLLGIREPVVEEVAAEPAYKPVRKALLNYNLGRNLLKLGNKEKALDKLEAAAEADEKFTAPRILLGHLLLEEKTAEANARAEELFRAAVAVDGENVSAVCGLGEALLGQEKVDEAAGHFARALEIDPTYTPAVANMALVKAHQGKMEESTKHFQEALELNPLDPGTYYRRGESLEVQGNLDGAAADYRRAIEILMGLPSTADKV